MILAQEDAVQPAIPKIPDPGWLIDWWNKSGQDLAVHWGLKILAAVAVLIIGWIAVRIITSVTRRIMNRAKVDPMLSGFAANMTYMGLMALVFISALQAAGFPTTSFVAIIGAAGLAVGFALQGSLGNFAAGVLLIFFRPFKVGDYIEAGGTAGVVEELQVFASKLRTPDNKAVIVPNSAIAGGNIVNYSAKETRRLDLVFGIGYDDDLRKAKQIIDGILAKDERVLKDPEPTVAVLELADSSVNIAVRPWVKGADYWPLYFDLLEGIKLAFDAQGISIPFPQRDVHIHQTTPAA